MSFSFKLEKIVRILGEIILNTKKSLTFYENYNIIKNVIDYISIEKQEGIIMMTVDEKKFFLEELKKVPNRDVLKVATREEILRIAEEIDFKAIKEMAYGLGLEKKDIPSELLFEANFFFSLSLEVSIRGSWGVFDVWNLKDSDTYQMVEKYATLICGVEDTKAILDLYYFDLDFVLHYAKSDRPDLT